MVGVFRARIISRAWRGRSRRAIWSVRLRTDNWPRGGQMRFGFFDQLPCPTGFSEPQRYRDFIAQIELGDALGFDTAWLGEIHFCRAFSILADPILVLAAAAQRTTRIRLGTAVTLLPLHNPIKIVEEAATADILSDGRLEFGVGRGVAYQYPGYGVPLEENRERFEDRLILSSRLGRTSPFRSRESIFGREISASCRNPCNRRIRLCASRPTAPTRSLFRGDASCQSSLRL